MTDNNTLLEIQFKQIFDKLKSNEELINKIFERLDNMNSILQRNTVVVEEHHKRSTTLENMMASHEKVLHELAMSIQKLNSRMDVFDNQLQRTNNDIRPLKNKVENLGRFALFIDGIPSVITFSISILTLISLGYAVFKLFIR